MIFCSCGNPGMTTNEKRNHVNAPAIGSVIVALSLGLLAVSLDASPTSAATSQSAQASAIATLVQDAMKTEHLRAVIVKITQGDKVKLDDTIDRWMPDLPEANKVTLRMLANQTSGYPDFESDPKFLAAFNADPFHIFTFEERLKIAFSRPTMFEPGSNWGYAHTNFMILGEILSKIGGKPLDALLKEKVFMPMGLKSTTASQTSEMPTPILHAFDSERRSALKIPAEVAFTEE